MKYYVLDEEEKQLLDEFERGEWKRIKNFAKEKKLFEAAARNTLNKKKNINIRLSEKDLHKLKVKAAEDGIPYQTLVGSVLHRFANKQTSSSL
jgi:predicted DNA binding CopG/RHH family protein